MSTPRYDDPKKYDARKVKPLEAYLESLWKPILSTLASDHIHNNDTVADFGCGTLAHIDLMIHAKKIYAVDANEKMLRFGLNKLSDQNRSHIIPLIEPATLTSIPPHSCSVIWSIGLTEYVNIDDLFKEMARVATNQCTTLLQFPNRYNIIHIAIQIAHAIRGTQSKTYRTKSEIRKVANKYGWHIEKAFSTGFYTPAPAVLIPILSAIWKYFNAFGNNTFLVLRNSSQQ